MAKILICDDDPNHSEMVKDFMESVGHAVSLAVDPVNFIAKAKALKPDIVVMDLEMPAGGGVQAVRNLEGHPDLAQARVIYCSGLPPEKAQSMIPPNPRNRFLPKPINLNSLLKVLKEFREEAPGK